MRCYVQATDKLGAGSVYLILFGSGEAGRLGVSRTGCGVAVSSAMLCLYLGVGPFQGSRMSTRDGRVECSRA